MKRLTITFDDDIYSYIYKISKENKKTFRETLMEILKKEIYKSNEDVTSIKDISKDIKESIYLLNKIIKKQSLHYLLSVQHFVNHGYLSNADPNESASYKELLNKHKNKFND